ncbi:uncharacterized protein PAC_07608 [Phialocephala subalpina]|uniref:Uncharacterized protein n=1 Tax=Phialocephala subalpina TaxID=576137 RepID=A0A1L7WY83_9HELO|nr:uncharacterized protein PAC_07608 [Phialocephala subalpina]
MVTLKHEIPSDMEYEYADHTISERPGPILKAGIARDPSQNEPPPTPPLGHNNGQPERPKSQFHGFIESMNPAGRREYAGQLDIFIQHVLDESAQPGRIAGQDYELQLKLLELQNKKLTLKQRIDQDGREGAIASASVSPSHTLSYQEQLYVLEAQSKKRWQLARLEQAWMKSCGLDRVFSRTPESYQDPVPGVWESDYERLLTFLKQQNQRLAGSGASGPAAPNGNHSLQDYYDPYTASGGSERTGQPGNHALQDYQMQLMLEEKEINGWRKRSGARAAAAAAASQNNAPPIPPDQIPAPRTIELPPLVLRNQPPIEMYPRHLDANPAAYPCGARLSNGLDQCNLYSASAPSWTSNNHASDLPSTQFFGDTNATGAGNPSNAGQAHAQHHTFQNLHTYGTNHHDFPPTKYHDTTTGSISYKTPGPRLLQPDADGNLVDIDGSLIYQANNINEVSGPGCSAFTSGQQGNSQSTSVSAYPTYQPTLQPAYQHPFVSGPSRCLPDYQMQLMLLEQQNKKRLMMARQEQDSMMGTFRVNPPRMGQDYQMQLMLLEQQNKKRLMRARNRGPDPMPEEAADQNQRMLDKIARGTQSLAQVKAEALSSPETSPEPMSYLTGSPGMSCNPAPSSVIFTPESSVAPSPPPSALEHVLNFGRPLEIRGPAPGNFGSQKSYPTDLEL